MKWKKLKIERGGSSVRRNRGKTLRGVVSEIIKTLVRKETQHRERGIVFVWRNEENTLKRGSSGNN